MPTIIIKKKVGFKINGISENKHELKHRHSTYIFCILLAVLCTNLVLN